ncbi:malonate decarboxylase holo-[acyl-carrier-protein] synthase [Polynucleobacter sp. IMCC30063]|uniref:malonate decarboxylase holo-[acyl-carrier-protein] synthase n=1 Tax=Polynucleobacter sp. IMCC30063 TaxID=2907298 RepID=UPI001F2F0AF9|nr:malonate decarboxylase holo-[acyl-carrier-protein] synthase [Polynucleobacter sp. IMCC30063]MCE7506738.1 malonate decarboxylase holo-[acyl-carrier-protein] synthase [Polynucleobacter sp. IMCC30063]
MYEIASLAPWRHRQIWIRPEDAGEVFFERDESREKVNYLVSWIKQNKPLVGRAFGQANLASTGLRPIGLLQLGSPKSKQRLYLLVKNTVIDKVEQPLLLASVLAYLPLQHCLCATHLLALLQGVEVEIRVYGSAFWSHAQKSTCMTEESDLDLIIQTHGRNNIEKTFVALNKCSNLYAIRLDGELELPDGNTVAWRELSIMPDKILVKSDHGPSLQNCSEIWAQLA